MDAIETKYVPATNSRPSRIKATWMRNSFYRTYDDEHSVRDNHAMAAMEMVRARLIISKKDVLWLCAETKKGYVFVPENADQFSEHAGQK